MYRIRRRVHIRNVAGAVVLAAGLVASLGSPARAQVTSSPAAPGQPGWSFNLAPYVWLPWLNINLNYNLPNGVGGRLPTSLTVGPGEIYNNIRFGGTGAADARYGKYSILTDFIYLNEGFDASGTRLRSVDFAGAPSQRIPSGSVIDASSVAKTTIWTLAGGYTVLQGDWGNLDVIAGLRYLGVDSTTGFSLATTFTGPRGNEGVLGGSGTVTSNANIWNGIAGVRGRVRIPNSYFFVPYYFDIGAGGSELTWQASTGIGYQSGRAGLSAQYRYLAFEQSNRHATGKISMSGPMIMVNIGF